MVKVWTWDEGERYTDDKWRAECDAKAKDEVSYKDLLNYNPDTGVFTWKVRTASRAAPGTEAGWFDKDGYRCVTVLGKKIKCHRLAWWWMRGVWPEDGVYIDHINRVKDDNRIDNLRIATPSQSAMNRGAQSNNTSGHKGVFQTKGYWHARIQIAGETIPLGYYDNVEAAVAAYEEAAQNLQGEFYYGNR